MATTIQYYQQAVNDYEDQVRDYGAELAFANEQVADANRVLAELRAQRSSVAPDSPEQAALLEQINNTISRRSDFEVRQQNAFNSLQTAQSSLTQAQRDLTRVSQGLPAPPAPPTPAAAAADPAVRAVETRVVDTNNQVVQNFTATAQTDPAEIPGVTVGDRLQTDPAEIPGETVFGPSLATDPGVPTQQLREVPVPVPAPVPDIEDDIEGGAVGFPEETFAGDGYGFVYDENGELIPSDSADAERIRSTPADTEDEFAGNGYGFVYDENGELIPADSADAERVTAFTAEPQPDPSEEDDPAELARIQQEDEFEAARQETLTQQAQQQAALKAQQRQINRADWRVRLTLADSADYLYMDPGAGQQSVLYPLKVSNGVVFPYTPKISTSYRANYDAYDLTHSNYRGYFYKGSNTDAVSIMATFTAQDTAEANYVLAVIHFFRAVTRMFYGANDPNRGTPPPLVFLHGLGQYQFSGAPCVVSNFMYSLPDDVDYIRAGSANTAGLQDLNYRRDRAALPTNVFTSAIERLRNAGLPPGAEGNTTNRQNFPDKIINSVPVFGQDDPTYVPTKIEIEIELLPMQSRQQISQEYNFADYASGKLITRGYW